MWRHRLVRCDVLPFGLDLRLRQRLLFPMPSRLEPVLDHNILDHDVLVENVVFDYNVVFDHDFFDQNVVYHNVVYDYHNLVQNVVYDDHFELSYAYLDYVGCRSRTVRRTRVRAARLPVRLCLRNHQPVLQPVFAGCALGYVHDHDQEYLDDQFVRHTVCDPVSDVQPRLHWIGWLHAVHRQLRRCHPPGRPNFPGGRSRQLPSDPEIAVLARSDVHQTGSRVDPERVQRQL